MAWLRVTYCAAFPSFPCEPIGEKREGGGVEHASASASAQPSQARVSAPPPRLLDLAPHFCCGVVHTVGHSGSLCPGLASSVGRGRAKRGPTPSPPMARLAARRRAQSREGDAICSAASSPAAGAANREEGKSTAQASAKKQKQRSQPPAPDPRIHSSRK
jgi:hypothetical protein